MAKVLDRLVFIDETSLNTKMVKTAGWSPVGERLIDHTPFGHWNTQTFIAGLRHDGLTAPWVIDGPINRRRFDTYIETQLVPTLSPGDVVILDNLSSHKSAKAKEDLKAVGAWFLFLPQYSPDLNPIEMAFAKLKALIRKAAARSYDALWQAVGAVRALFHHLAVGRMQRCAGAPLEHEEHFTALVVLGDDRLARPEAPLDEQLRQGVAPLAAEIFEKALQCHTAPLHDHSLGGCLVI